MADPVTRQLNRCIHCDACKHVCPVYEATGKSDDAIEHIYTGPVSAISKMRSENFEEFNFLSRTTTLCGACTDVCPVKINLHNMFVHERQKIVGQNLNPQSEKLFYFLWKQSMLKRERWSFAKNVSKKLLQQNLFEKMWGNKNDMPELAAKSFNDLWREKYG
jgi:L-lactate dehydrogenase complex protein LldF